MTATVSVLRFSPMPELREYVNVALLISKGRGADMVYDPAFPRLRCTSPEMRIELLEAHLESLRPVLAETHVKDLAERLARLSPQFALGTPHTIPEPTDAVVRHLRAEFLSRAPSHRTREDQGERIASLVGSFVMSHFGVSDAIARKNVSIASIFGTLSISPRLGKIRVPRAIVGPKDVVLVDGLSFRATRHNLRERAERIRFMGFSLDKARRDIESELGLSVLCGTALFNEPSKEERDEEQEYVVKQVAEYTDILSASDSATLARFAAVARRAAESFI